MLACWNSTDWSAQQRQQQQQQQHTARQPVESIVAAHSESYAVRLCSPQHRQSWHNWFCFLCMGASTILRQLQLAQRASCELKLRFECRPLCACCCCCKHRIFGRKSPSLHCTKPGSFPPSRCLPALWLPYTAGAASRHGPFSFSDSFEALRRWVILQATIARLPPAGDRLPQPNCCPASRQSCFRRGSPNSAVWHWSPGLSWPSSSHANAARDAKPLNTVALELEFEPRRRESGLAFPAIWLQCVAIPFRLWSNPTAAATALSVFY